MIYQLVHFVVLVDSREKIKKSKKINKDLDFARELKNLLDMKMMVIAIINGTFGAFSKGQGKRLRKLKIRGKIETI